MIIITLLPNDYFLKICHIGGGALKKTAFTSCVSNIDDNVVVIYTTLDHTHQVLVLTGYILKHYHGL